MKFIEEAAKTSNKWIYKQVKFVLTREKDKTEKKDKLLKVK